MTMCIVRVIGDIHGQIDRVKCYLGTEDVPTILTGDVNLFGYDYWLKAIPQSSGEYVQVNYTPEYPVHFIDGNHDNFSKLDTNASEIVEVSSMLHYIPRGYVSGRVLFLGGADSIDRNVRTAGYDWYPEERITERQMNHILSLDPNDIEVVISHEAPLSIIEQKVFPEIFPSQKAMDEILDVLKPELWIHSHYHLSYTLQDNVRGCNVIGLGVDEVMDLNLPIGDDLKKG